MEINGGRDHMTIVLKLLVDDVLILRFDFLQPDIPVSAVDGDVLVEKELEPAACVGSEPILRIVKAARALHGRVVPSASSEQKGSQSRRS